VGGLRRVAGEPFGGAAGPNLLAGIILPPNCKGQEEVRRSQGDPVGAQMIAAGAETRFESELLGAVPSN
jgi:hypothetical protein